MTSKTVLLIVTILLLTPALGGSTVPTASAAPSTADPGFTPGELLVRFESGTSESERARVRRHHGLSRIEGLPLPGLELVRIPDRATVPELAARLSGLPTVRYAEPNALFRPAYPEPSGSFPDDEHFELQWALRNTGQFVGSTADADTDYPAAERVGPEVEEPVVAVIDTGVDIGHPDLAGNIWTNPGEIPGNGKDDDGNGFVDDVHGWDFLNDDATVAPTPSTLSHGTHIAGIIGAVTNNGRDIAGISRAQIMVLPFIGEESGTSADAIEALDYAIQMGAHVTNNSYGSSETGSFNLAFQEKVEEADQAGQLFVAAAGNAGSNNDLDPFYPASFTNQNIIAVAATTTSDGLWSGSNYGATSVDLGAPGTSILSTIPGDAVEFQTGTSQAAPHVTGAVVRVLDAWPDIGHLDVKDRILDGGDPADELAATTVTGRRLNLAGALDEDGEPQLTEVGASPDPISPDGDDRRDRTSITWTMSEPAVVTTEVLAPDGSTVVRSETVGPRAAGRNAWGWDGRRDDGSVVTDGAYTVRIHASDADENTASAQTTVDVQGAGPPFGIDFNGDGFGDLAVGAPGEGIGSRDGAGAVNVLYGSSGGLTTSGNQVWYQSVPGVGGGSETGDNFGGAVATGDFNGDGFDDVAVGVPGEGIGSKDGAGAVNVLYGSSGGLTTSGNHVLHQDTPGIGGKSEAGDGFGTALATGDIDADGRMDLAVGVPGEGIGSRDGAGAVNVVFGSSGGLTTSGSQVWYQDQSGVEEVSESGDRFGAALAAGDLDGDGDAELAVGVPRERIGSARAGAVHILPGSEDGVTTRGDYLVHQNTPGVPGGAEAGDRFGSSLAVDRLNEDLELDLVVGVPSEAIGSLSSAGAVNVLYGGADGIPSGGSQIWHQDTPGIEGKSETGDHFGAATWTGDINGDRAVDLSIGVPLEGIGSNGCAHGAVNVLYGSGSGITSTSDQIWHQDIPGVAGVSETNDRLGQVGGTLTGEFRGRTTCLSA